jgi:tRNA-dihydrouridine synthase
MQAITVHGRTRAQGYSGEADWEVIAQVADAVKIPVIGNGDITSGSDVEVRRAQTNVRGIMIGRAAMANPWVFQEAKHYLATGTHAAPATVEQRFALMRRHVQLAVAHSRHGGEFEIIRSMRNRLMQYTRSIRGGKYLRQQFSQVGSIADLDRIFAAYYQHQAEIMGGGEELEEENKLAADL